MRAENIGLVGVAEELRELLAMSKSAREFCHRFLLSCLTSSKGCTVNELFSVQSFIIARIVRSQEALELLLKEGFSIEAAVVALSQFELCLDVLYIDGNVQRATKWIGHDSKRYQPWKVTDKINEVYRLDRKRKDAQYKIFEMLSSVKHGNPTASGFGFPIRTEGRKVSVITGEIDDPFALSYKLTICGFCTCQLLEALEGVKRAFSKFINIDNGLCKELAHLLQESKRKMAQIMHHIDMVEDVLKNTA